MLFQPLPGKGLQPIMTHDSHAADGHSHDSHHPAPGDTGAPPTTPVLLGIALAVVIWSVMTSVGFNQPTPIGSAGHAEHADPTHAAEHPAEGDSHAEHDDHAKPQPDPSYLAVLPFVLLLGAIAVFPLIGALEHFWENNQNKLFVAGGLAIVTLVYYQFFYVAGGMESVKHVLEHAILADYIPFIVLLFSLYTISGGIRIEGDLPAHPSTNAVFMIIGAALASFVGTTGAAMLLIRPLLETNKERKLVGHTVVFFIFTVCNTGGCLLPIGDPPLFLGYLKGVDFLWTAQALWLPWLVTNALVIGVYFAWDSLLAYPAEAAEDIRFDETRVKPITIRGWELNLPLLVGVILSVAFLAPEKTIPGTGWQPWVYLREVVQILLVALSLALGKQEVREDNGFNYGAIVEVAALFIGIFITMQPALLLLKNHGTELGIDHPLQFFWATGALSSVLDNAPTYLVFYEAAGAGLGGDLAHLIHQTGDVGVAANEKLVGISLGAVFLGAMTYIGNGPNFMVRAIAEQSGVKMPSFFGYCFQFSLPVLLPIFALVSAVFLWLL